MIQSGGGYQLKKKSGKSGKSQQVRSHQFDIKATKVKKRRRR